MLYYQVVPSYVPGPVKWVSFHCWDKMPRVDNWWKDLFWLTRSEIQFMVTWLWCFSSWSEAEHHGMEHVTEGIYLSHSNPKGERKRETDIRQIGTYTGGRGQGHVYSPSLSHSLLLPSRPWPLNVLPFPQHHQHRSYCEALKIQAATLLILTCLLVCWF